jgi:hypothetical protein
MTVGFKESTSIALFYLGHIYTVYVEQQQATLVRLRYCTVYDGREQCIPIMSITDRPRTTRSFRNA